MAFDKSVLAVGAQTYDEAAPVTVITADPFRIVLSVAVGPKRLNHTYKLLLTEEDANYLAKMLGTIK